MPTRKPTRKPVQISIDKELLRRVDTDAETRARGRSAFIASAVVAYLGAKQAREIDDGLIATLGPHADEIFRESLPMIESQVWPPDDDLVEDHAQTPRKRRAAR